MDKKHRLENGKYYFDRLRLLRDKLNPHLKLSMGMSNAYEISLNYGSNLIRVGSRIFNWKKLYYFFFLIFSKQHIAV